MRRRLDLHEGISDCSTRPHHYLDEYDGALTLGDPPLALYDDGLWSELLEAQQRLGDAERRVVLAAVAEPLDSVEVECGLQMWRMILGDFDLAEFERLEDVLRQHATTCHTPR